MGVVHRTTARVTLSARRTVAPFGTRRGAGSLAAVAQCDWWAWRRERTAIDAEWMALSNPVTEGLFLELAADLDEAATAMDARCRDGG